MDYGSVTDEKLLVTLDKLILVSEARAIFYFVDIIDIIN
jgi:hypothetical protein